MLKKVNYSVSLILMMIFASNTQAQIGGTSVFRFLDLPNSPRIAALGGTLTAIKDQDISQSFLNPSLLNQNQHKKLSLNYCNYIADINFGNAQYVYATPNKGIFSAGIFFLNYGNFEEADAAGNLTGNQFSASDYLLNIGWGKTILKNINFGANLKSVYSSYEIYRSFALAADLSFSYHDSSSNFTATVIGRNLGYQFKKFYQQRENLPAELTLAISQKLKYAPIRYHLAYKNLQRFKQSFKTDPDVVFDPDLTPPEPIENQISFGDELLRHFVIGAELSFTPAFAVQVGYNHQRNKELSLANSGGAAGLSIGVSLNLKKIQIGYAHSQVNVAGGNNYFSVQYGF